MQNITIFCSASDTVAPIYKNEAETVGQWIGTHDKPVIICNTQGLFNPLIQQIELLRKENFLRYDRPDLYHIVPDAKTCCELLERYNR